MFISNFYKKLCKKLIKNVKFVNSCFICRIHPYVHMAQMPALIPKEVEIQRLKKIWLIVIAMGSTAASVEVDNFVDGFFASNLYQR